jgi:tellurium resistance protein TerD
MAVNLVKGQNTVLDMNVFHVGLGWDVNEGASQFDFDLDVAAFLIGSNKKTMGDDYLVFYNSEKRVKPSDLKTIVSSSLWSDNDKLRHESRPVDPELSVIGSIDDEDGQTSEDGDDETMDINLNKVNPNVQEIIITVSIYEWEKRKQNFGQVERAYVRLYKPGHEAEGKEDYRYDLTEDFSACASVEFCRLYRHNGAWKVQATGIAHKGGLEELVAKYM